LDKDHELPELTESFRVAHCSSLLNEPG
jgi:hypothetical protein